MCGSSCRSPILWQFVPNVNFYSDFVGAPGLCQVPMLWQFVPPINFYGAFGGAMTLCRFLYLYNAPTSVLASCRFPWYLMVNSYAVSWQLFFSWYLIVDWYSAWCCFLDNFLPHGGIRILKALSGADLITLPYHGGPRICKALSNDYLVFLTSWRSYVWSCFYILLDSPLHFSCGVFISVKIRSCLHVLIALLIILGADK